MTGGSEPATAPPLTADPPQAGTPPLAARMAARIAAGAGRGAELIAALMFACVFVVFGFKIVMRYLAHDAVAWADEVSVVLFVWIIFWANAFILGERDQITFDLVYRPMPPSIRRFMAVLRLVLIGGIFLWALPGSIDYIAFLWRERTPVLSLRLDLVYSCFGIFMVAVVVRSLCNLVRLLGPDWRARI
jgi:TRAP-type C4-dicarboxylate transport system permease small subunit